MTQSDIINLIKEVGAALVILGGIVTTVLAGLGAYRRVQAEIEEKKSLLAQAKSAKVTEDNRLEVELTERLQKLSADLLSQMEERYTLLNSELKQVRSELDRVTRKNTLLRSAGLSLIKGIEISLKARSDQVSEEGTVNCGACLSSDAALLRQLLEVRELFEKENGE